MPQWGGTRHWPTSRRARAASGRWSILLAGLAAAGRHGHWRFFALSDGGSESSANAATLALGIVYFLIAPILHVLGIVFGLLGIGRDDGDFPP